MNKRSSFVFAMIVTSFVCMLGSSNAAENIKADSVVDISESTVSYVIDTVGGEALEIVIDYNSKRPVPDIENMDISPVNPASDGTKTFRIMTKEQVPIDIQYSYAGAERTGMRILAEPPNASSDAEYSQMLSVESKAGNIINFTLIWQGKELREVRIEPLVNPFVVN